MNPLRLLLITVLSFLTPTLSSCTSGGTDGLPSEPESFDPSRGTATDKVRWGVQFALANNVITDLGDDPQGQARVIEEMSKGMCSFLDAGGTVVGSVRPMGGLSQREQIVFTAIAVSAYCPEYKSEFDALLVENEIVLELTSWTPADSYIGGPTANNPG